MALALRDDAERGQAAFVAFRCYDCHRVSVVDLPAVGALWAEG